VALARQPGVAHAAGERLARRLPPEYHPQRYAFIAHGTGLSDEYPVIRYDRHHPGELEENMVLSVEVYVGEVGGREGVKLEEEVLVTETGVELISDAPHDERLL
jgi:Xaa-Pro aminopeptidase